MYIVDLKKKIKELTEELTTLVSDRSRNSTFKYTMEEKANGDVIKPSISLENYTISIQNLHEELLRLKAKLRKANETVCDNGNSIIENITELKQLTAEYYTVKGYTETEKVKRINSGFGSSPVIEYQELNYDIGWMKKYIDCLKSDIDILQQSIDRANLTTKVE